MKRKYGALRVIAVILTVLAWIVLVVGVLLSILGGVMGWDALTAMDLPGGATVTAVAIIMGIIFSVIYFLILLGAAQLIYLLMDVERNTRETAYRLRAGTREPLEPME